MGPEGSSLLIFSATLEFYPNKGAYAYKPQKSGKAETELEAILFLQKLPQCGPDALSIHLIVPILNAGRDGHFTSVA